MMSDGSLSQDEIDALLQGGLEMNFDEAPIQEVAPTPTIPADLATINSIFAKNTESLDRLLKSLLDDTSVLSVPVATSSNRDDLLNVISDEVVLIQADFADQISGGHFFILDVAMAKAMAGKMQGLAQADLNDAGMGALEEAINTFAGNISTFLSSTTGRSVSCGVVKASRMLKASIKGLSDQFVKIVYPYRFDGVGASEIVEVIAKEPVLALFPLAQNQPMNMGMGAVASQPMMSQAQPAMSMPIMPQQMAAQMPMNQMQMGNPMMSNMMNQQMMGMPQGIQPVQFTALNSIPGSGEIGNIGLLMDVFMEMTVELGRTKRLIKDILGMGEGTIIELDKLAGEPVDILVNHKLIAKGEVVVIDENFGVRVTEIVSPMERINEN